eukprot:979345_1
MKSNPTVFLMVFRVILGIIGPRTSYCAKQKSDVAQEDSYSQWIIPLDRIQSANTRDVTQDDTEYDHGVVKTSNSCDVSDGQEIEAGQWDFSAWPMDFKFNDKDTTQQKALQTESRTAQSPKKHDVSVEDGGNEMYLQDFGQNNKYTLSGYIHDSERTLDILVPQLVVDEIDKFYTDTEIVSIRMTSDLHLDEKELECLKLFFESHIIESSICPTLTSDSDCDDPDGCWDLETEFEMYDIIFVPLLQHYNHGFTDIQFEMLPDYDTILFGSMASFTEYIFSIKWFVTKSDDIVKGRNTFKKLWDHENTKLYVNSFGKSAIQPNAVSVQFDEYGEKLESFLLFDMAGKKKTSQ